MGFQAFLKRELQQHGKSIGYGPKTAAHDSSEQCTEFALAR
jgi:hypothetical protein